MDSEMEAAEAEAELLFSTRQATSGVTSTRTEVGAWTQGLLEPLPFLHNAAVPVTAR